MFYKSFFCLSLFLLVRGQEVDRPGPPDFCAKNDIDHVDDRFHKDAPSPESSDFEECHSWQDSSCCTHALTVALSSHRSMAQGLYNWTFDLCPTSLSPRCSEYLKNEECFYWCEPMLGHFQNNEGFIEGVPVCADYCDAWFEACKDDFTCIENWLDLEYDIAVNPSNSCPAGSTCRTFREVYGNGEGLCNRMWGTDFVYSTDMDNCTVMTFDNSMSNPNFRLSFPKAGGVAVTTAATYGLTLLMFLVIAITVIY